MISRTKAQLTNAIRLQSNLNRKKNEKFFTTENKKDVQFAKQVEKINHVHKMTKDNVSRSNSLRRHTMKSKNLYKRMKRFAKNLTNDFKKFYRRFINFVLFQISLTNFLMKNFYIQTMIRFRKSLFNI